MIAPEASEALHRLHYLRPEDEDSIAEAMVSRKFRRALTDAVVNYLVSIASPDGVDLDRVSVLVHQLNAAQFWNYYPPAEFVTAIGSQIHSEMLFALSSALKLPAQYRVLGITSDPSGQPQYSAA